jgi:hypothetical protein
MLYIPAKISQSTRVPNHPKKIRHPTISGVNPLIRDSLYQMLILNLTLLVTECVVALVFLSATKLDLPDILNQHLPGQTA